MSPGDVARAIALVVVVGGPHSCGVARAEEPLAPSVAVPEPTPSSEGSGEGPLSPPPPVMTFMLASEPEILPPQPRLDMPIKVTMRSLVLPKLGLSASLGFLYDRPGPRTVQVPKFSAALALGAGANLEFDLGFTAPIEGAMQLSFGALWKLVGADAIEFGLGSSIGMFTLDPGRERALTLAVRPTMDAPLVLHAGNMLRFESGLHLAPVFPTDGTSPAFAALASRTTDPSIPGPGVPAKLTFQPLEQVFIGAQTGFGMLELRAHQSGDEILDGFFMPLDFQLGGTVPIDNRPLLDITGVFGFPFLLIGAEEPAFTELWQLGLSLRVFAAL